MTFIYEYRDIYGDIPGVRTSYIKQGSHYILVVKFKDFQRPWSCIFKDQFSTEVYSMNSITVIFNIYFCDYGTVLVDKNKT